MSVSEVLDPFDWPDQPERAPRDASEIPERQLAGKVIPLAGEQKRTKKADTESMTRKYVRELGYTYARTETLEGGWKGGVIKKDLFGFVDGIAIGHGEIVFVQTTTPPNYAAHVRKLLTGTFKIGNGKPTPCLPVLKQILESGARFMFLLWHQPDGFGTRWQCRKVDVTPELVAEWESKREKRNGKR